jgi:exopolyphosphatase/guanosine-5'-triphosphate,3'-diphosphate pyrophosphatase
MQRSGAAGPALFLPGGPRLPIRHPGHRFCDQVRLRRQGCGRCSSGWKAVSVADFEDGAGVASWTSAGETGEQRAPGPRVSAAGPDTRMPPPLRPRGARGEVAALDLGTNNCRLLIARRASADFQVVDAFSRVVRLGEGLAATGRLSEAAMERTLAALRICAAKLARRRVAQVRSVATEACRRAENGAEFVGRVYAETGLALDVISPAEEARLAVLGCRSLIEPEARQTIVFDIGGGSTEVVLIERCADLPGEEAGLAMRGWVSIPWGVVSLAETEAADAGSEGARMAAFARMTARVAEHLGGLSARLGPGVRLLGASGTVTTLASLHMGLPRYDRRLVDGSWMATADLRALSRRLAERSPEERSEIPGIGPDRAALVVAGCAILEALLDASRAARLRVADRGIREGILRSLLARQGLA